MSLIDRIRAVLWPAKPEASTRLRNKPGGMAWVKPYGHAYGAQALAGRAVKTVMLDVSGFWIIDPPQQYILKGRDPLHCVTGNVVHPGGVVIVIGLSDDVLEPWKEDGDGVTDAEVRKLYEPPIPLRVRGTTSDL